MQCPSVIPYPATVPCPGPLPSSDLFNHMCVFSLSQMLVFLSLYVIFNILLSIFICAAASLFFAWVASAHVSAMSLLEVAMSCRRSCLQTYSNVTLEDVTVLGKCCPSGRDSYLNFHVFVFVFGAVSVPGRYSFQHSQP